MTLLCSAKAAAIDPFGAKPIFSACQAPSLRELLANRVFTITNHIQGGGTVDRRLTQRHRQAPQRCFALLTGRPGTVAGAVHHDVDHLTRYVLPGDWDLGWAGSSIGRIAFPLFAAMVAGTALSYPQPTALLTADFDYRPRRASALYANATPRYVHFERLFYVGYGLALGALVRQGWQHYQRQTLGFGWPMLGRCRRYGVVSTGILVEYGHNGLLPIPLLVFATALSETRKC